MFGNQSGYYSLMKPLKMSEQLSMKATFRNGDDKIFKKSSHNYCAIEYRRL